MKKLTIGVKIEKVNTSPSIFISYSQKSTKLALKQYEEYFYKHSADQIINTIKRCISTIYNNHPVKSLKGLGPKIHKLLSPLSKTIDDETYVNFGQYFTYDHYLEFMRRCQYHNTNRY